MGPIPIVRQQMIAALADRDLDESALRRAISGWLPKLYRRPSQRTANRTPISRSRSIELKAKVIALKRQRPDLNQHQIAVALGVRNTGRVSEWLRGYA
jgi:hypothetical protein